MANIGDIVIHKHGEGLSIRRIADLLHISPSTVFRYIHNPNKVDRRQVRRGKTHRCPTCGALLNQRRCLSCVLARRYKATANKHENLEVLLASGCLRGLEIKLDLRPPEYERYLEVRAKRQKMENMEFQKAKNKLKRKAIN